MILDESGQIIEHFGVRGMRWGSRKSAGSSSGSSPPKMSRKERKVEKKAALKKADAEYAKKVEDLVNRSVKNQTLIAIQTKHRTEIMTGQEAAQRIMRTGRIPRNAVWYEGQLNLNPERGA